jgi:hypothetical protein
MSSSAASRPTSPSREVDLAVVPKVGGEFGERLGERIDRRTVTGVERYYY